MKNLLRSVALLLVGLMLGYAGPAFAATADDVDTVTSVVNGHLSIADTTGDFSLTFSDFVSGTETPIQTVTYQVKGNDLPATALVGVISAKIDALEYGIDLRADPGTYANVGSTGNIALANTAAGFSTIGTTAVNLADKAATTGEQAKILNGNQPMDWKAVATKDLTAGSYPMILTVTLKDA